MRVRYAPRALRDIDEVLAYILERSPQGAHNVSVAIQHTITVCATHPRAGTKTDVPGLYRRPLSKYRITLFYRISPDACEIEVVRVVRGARVKDLQKLPDDA